MNYKKCNATTTVGDQCKREAKDEYCYLHKFTKSEAQKKMYRDAEERSRRYIKYVSREYRKYCIRHRRYMETSRCSALTKKGTKCQMATESKFCHLHKFMGATGGVESEKADDDPNYEVVNEDIICAGEVAEDDPVQSFIEDLHTKSSKLKDREYTGTVTNFRKLNKILELYESEKYYLRELYASCHSQVLDPPLLISELDRAKMLVSQQVSRFCDLTDEEVLEIEAEEDRSDLGLLMAELEKIVENIEARVYRGPQVDTYVKGKVDGYYTGEKIRKIDNVNGILRSFSTYESLEDYGSTADIIRNEVQEMIEEVEKDTNYVVDFTVERYLTKDKRPSSRYK